MLTRLEKIRLDITARNNAIDSYNDRELTDKLQPLLEWVHNDIEYLLNEVERYRKALSILCNAEQSHTLVSVERIAIEALKEGLAKESSTEPAPE